MSRWDRRDELVRDAEELSLVLLGRAIHSATDQLEVPYDSHRNAMICLKQATALRYRSSPERFRSASMMFERHFGLHDHNVEVTLAESRELGMTRVKCGMALAVGFERGWRMTSERASRIVEDALGPLTQLLEHSNKLTVLGAVTLAMHTLFDERHKMQSELRNLAITDTGLLAASWTVQIIASQSGSGETHSE